MFLNGSNQKRSRQLEASGGCHLPVAQVLPKAMFGRWTAGPEKQNDKLTMSCWSLENVYSLFTLRYCRICLFFSSEIFTRDSCGITTRLKVKLWGSTTSSWRSSICSWRYWPLFFGQMVLPKLFLSQHIWVKSTCHPLICFKHRRSHPRNGTRVDIHVTSLDNSVRLTRVAVNGQWDVKGNKDWAYFWWFGTECLVGYGWKQ